MLIMKKVLSTLLTMSLFFIVLAIPAKMLDLAMLRINSYEEYQEFIEKSDLTGDFVYYESISMFGEFDYLEFPGMYKLYGFDADGLQYGGYNYRLTVNEKDVSSDKNRTISINIMPLYTYDDLFGKESLIDVKTDDLSVSSKPGYYVFNEAVYVYSSNTVSSIRWENNGILYSIYPKVSKNEFNPDSVIGKLLNKNTAPEVIEMLKNYNFTGKPTEPTPPETADFLPIFPILSVISAGGFTALAVKKKKNK